MHPGTLVPASLSKICRSPPVVLSEVHIHILKYSSHYRSDKQNISGIDGGEIQIQFRRQTHDYRAWTCELCSQDITTMAAR